MLQKLYASVIDVLFAKSCDSKQLQVHTPFKMLVNGLSTTLHSWVQCPLSSMKFAMVLGSLALY